jgi:hypothetical protein
LLAALVVPNGFADNYVLFNDWADPTATPTITQNMSAPLLYQNNGGCSGGSFEYCASVALTIFGSGYSWSSLVFNTDSGPITVNLAGETSGTDNYLYIKDPGTNIVSDSVDIQYDGSRTLDLFFRSYDSRTGGPPTLLCSSVSPGCQLTEVEGWNMVLGVATAVSASGPPVSFAAEMNSDETPEPASIILLGSLLLGAGSSLRRKLRRLAA